MIPNFYQEARGRVLEQTPEERRRGLWGRKQVVNSSGRARYTVSRVPGASAVRIPLVGCQWQSTDVVACRLATSVLEGDFARARIRHRTGPDAQSTAAEAAPASEAGLSRAVVAAIERWPEQARKQLAAMEQFLGCFPDASDEPTPILDDE